MPSAFEQIEGCIKEAIQVNPHDSSVLKNALLKVSEKWSLREIIYALLNNPTQLEVVARNSYCHSNGFDKIVLIESLVPSFKVRLHVWWPVRDQRKKENIHNHRWSFASKLLRGELEIQNYWRSKEGEVYQEYLYDPAEKSTSESLKYLKNTPLTSSSSQIRYAGSCYTVECNEFHHVTTRPDLLAITLMLQGPPSQEAQVSVFKNDESESPAQEHRLSFTSSELEYKLRALLKLIELN